MYYTLYPVPLTYEKIPKVKTIVNSPVCSQVLFFMNFYYSITYFNCSVKIDKLKTPYTLSPKTLHSTDSNNSDTMVLLFILCTEGTPKFFVLVIVLMDCSRQTKYLGVLTTCRGRGSGVYFQKNYIFIWKRGDGDF